MTESLGAHLMEKLTQPIKFQGIGSGAQTKRRHEERNHSACEAWKANPLSLAFCRGGTLPVLEAVTYGMRIVTHRSRLLPDE